MVYSVYSCGSNGRFQLGTGSDEDLDSLEQVFQTETPVRKIVCGGNHTLILLDNGEAYTCGDNTYGQCGQTEVTSVPTFTKVDGLWKDCSAGYEFSIFVSQDDRLFSSGFGAKGELGQGEKKTKSATLTPIPLKISGTIVDIKSCLDHTVLLTDEGVIYGWGNGRSGKLGQPADSKIWEPRIIETDITVKHMDLGRDFTVFGDGQKIKLIGKDRFEIMAHELPKFEQFKTMWSSLHLVDDNGSIVSIGNNSHGQIIPEKTVKFDLFEVGSEHGVIVRDNKVICWGWGEHGNCGVRKKDSVTFDYFNVLREFGSEEKVVKVKGGCATTWVVTERNI